jgi:subtilisin family serine protease
MIRKIVEIASIILLLFVSVLATAEQDQLSSTIANYSNDGRTLSDGAVFISTEFLVKFTHDAPVSFSSSGNSIRSGVPSIDRLNNEFSIQNVERTFPYESIKEKNKYLFITIGLDRIYTFEVPKDVNILTAIAAYAANSYVEYAEPNFIGQAHAIPNDPMFTTQWGLRNDGTNPPNHPGTADADIDAPEAWDIETGDSSVIVAMLDTGIDWDHPDLSARIWNNADETVNGVDDDGNGYIDDIRGWDFANNDNNPIDDHGHGTVNAGIVGANTNNGVGVAGVDWHCKIMAVKVLNQNMWGLYSWWASGLKYAADNGAKVISMSMGGTSSSQTLKDAVDYAYGLNCVIVVSMGNDNSNTIYYPAAYSNVIAVGATDTDDTRCVPPDWQPFGMQNGGSNYGNHIDVVAPGNWINSTVWNNVYQYWGGTSMAAPFVSGLAALLFAKEPTLTNAEVQNIICITAEDQVGNPAEDTPGWDIYYGFGRINAYHALLYLTKPVLGIESIVGGTGIRATLNNTGFGDAIDIHWNITITGGFFVLQREALGNISSIPSGGSTEISMSVFGIGFGLLFPQPLITIYATYAEDLSIEKSVEATILFSQVTIK